MIHIPDELNGFFVPDETIRALGFNRARVEGYQQRFRNAVQYQ
jgi:hypothetical protein